MDASGRQGGFRQSSLAALDHQAREARLVRQVTWELVPSCSVPATERFSRSRVCCSRCDAPMPPLVVQWQSLIDALDAVLANGCQVCRDARHAERPGRDRRAPSQGVCRARWIYFN